MRHFVATAYTREFPGVTVSPDGLRSLATLTGEHDFSTAPTLAHALVTTSVREQGDFVIDLSEVDFFDASIIEVFVRFWRYLELQTRQLILRGASPFALEIFAICGVSFLLDASVEIGVSVGTGAE